MANKHLYSNMSWVRVTGNSTGSPSLVGELTEGEYSLTLRLTLANLTAQDSGRYRCSATHLVTGQQSYQEELVTVAGVCLSVREPLCIPLTNNLKLKIIRLPDLAASVHFVCRV